jgi:hypothetical protein
MGESGGLYYPNILNFPAIGTIAGTTRTGTTLQSTYDGSTLKAFPTADYSVMVIDVFYTTGSGEAATSIQIKLRDSFDNTNYTRLTNESAVAGVSTLTAREFTYAGGTGSTLYNFSYRLDISYRFMDIECKESGVGANKGNVFVEIQLAGL